MRILAVHPSPDRYGADRMLVRTLRALCDRGHEVHVVLPEDGPLVPSLRESGAVVTFMPFPVLRKSLMRPRGLLSLARGLVPTALRIASTVRETAPDVIYVNTITLPHWIVFGRLLGRRPVVCHVRELEENAPRWLNRLLLCPLLLTRSIIANSQATRQFLAAHLHRLGRRTRVVYNGFGTRLLPTPVRRPGRARLVLVGRLSPRKGQDLAVDALAEVVAAGHDAELVLAGTPFRGYEWYEERLRERAHEWGIADRVIFRGYVDDPLAEFAHSDLALVPSRLEPFGSVAVEAQLASCPVIVSDVGGLGEIVSHHRTGQVVAPDDVQALASAIRAALRDPAWAQAMAGSALREAVQRFGEHRYAVEVEEVLVDALGPRRRVTGTRPALEPAR